MVYHIKFPQKHTEACGGNMRNCKKWFQGNKYISMVLCFEVSPILWDLRFFSLDIKCSVVYFSSVFLLIIFYVQKHKACIIVVTSHIDIMWNNFKTFFTGSSVNFSFPSMPTKHIQQQGVCVLMSSLSHWLWVTSLCPDLSCPSLPVTQQAACWLLHVFCNSSLCFNLMGSFYMKQADNTFFPCSSNIQSSQ